MSSKRVVLLLGVLCSLGAAIPSAAATSTASAIQVHIEPHAQMHARGEGLSFRVLVRCGPLPGSPDFRETVAGAHQPRTGADGEGGLGPDLVCDGRWRIYTASVGLITEQRFRRGTAIATANVMACNIVRHGQKCWQKSEAREVQVH